MDMETQAANSEIEVIDALPVPPPGADPALVTYFADRSFKDRVLYLDDRYITASLYFERLLMTMMDDLLLYEKNDRMSRSNGDLFEATPLDSGRSIFAIKSAMGSGKTTLLRRYMEGIDAYEKTLPVEAKRMHIVIVICRRALGKMYITLLRDLGFVLYLEAADQYITDDRVICSPESYRRMQKNLTDGRRVFKSVDLLVLDEWITLMSALNGDTMSERRGLFYSVFQRYFIVGTTQVLIMDACLDIATLDMMQRLTRTGVVDDPLTGEGFEKKMYVVYNCKRTAAPGQIKITQSLEFFHSMISKAIAYCGNQEWEARRQDAILHADDPDYVPPKPRYQIIIAHASIAKSQALHQMLLEDWSWFLNRNNCVLINSASGGGNLRTSDWEDKLVIQHTSTIACGSDYNPSHHTGRTVFVFSYTSDQIPPDLMCQMTFRARLPIVHTILFYVPMQTTTVAQMDREELIHHLESTSEFLEMPSIANDRRAYVLTEELIDGAVYHVPRVNRNDFGLDLVLDQTMRKNRSRSNYLPYLMDVLSDISDEWRDARDQSYFQRLIETTSTRTPKEDRRLKRAERESTSRFGDAIFLGGWTALQEDIRQSPARLAIKDVLEKYNQENHYINAKSRDHEVWIYQACLILKRLGLSHLPMASDANLLDLLEDFLFEHKNWFHDHYDFFLLLVAGSKKVDSDCIAAYANSREHRVKAPLPAIQVSVILSTLHALFPRVVEEDGDNLRLRILYSCRAGSEFYFDLSSCDLTSESFKDAEKLPLVRLSDQSPTVYRLVFDGLRFPQALDGALECLCESSDYGDIDRFKKHRRFVAQICPQLAHRCLECIHFKLDSNPRRQYKVTVPYQRKKIAIRTYTLESASDCAMICYQLSKLAANIKKNRDDGPDLAWIMSRPDFVTFRFLGLWEALC